MRTTIYVIFFLSIIPILCLLVILRYRRNYNRDRDRDRESKSSIEFLSKADVSYYLRKDDDGYVSSMTTYDLIARGVKSRKEYLLITAEKAPGDFDETAKKRIKRLAYQADTLMPKPIASLKWTIACITNSVYEDGLPHTRSDIIFLPEGIMDSSDSEVLRILIHEKVHVYQRYYPEETSQWILSRYGTTPYKPRNSVPLIRANPDVDRWIYRDGEGRIYMRRYRNTKPKNISDSYGDLEHPYELMAHDISLIHSDENV